MSALAQPIGHPPPADDVRGSWSRVTETSAAIEHEGVSQLRYEEARARTFRVHDSQVTVREGPYHRPGRSIRSPTVVVKRQSAKVPIIRCDWAQNVRP
jgi:hypothetical protein